MNGFPQNLISYTRAAAGGLREIRHLSLSALRKVFSLMGKKEKIALAVLLALALGSFFYSAKNFYYSHTNPAPAQGGTYTEGLLGQPTYINPLLAHQEPDLSLTKLIFSGLYKYDNDGQLAPDLADGLPQISEDEKQYTVNLKHYAKWHNDKPLTADDVIFTIDLLKDPAYKSPLRAMWLSTSVEKLSDYSVKFTTKDISGPFADNLTLPILPKGIWGNVDGQNFLLSENNLKAVGSGPYAVKEIKKLPSGKVESMTLKSFANYYGGQAKISQIVFKFYDTEADILNAFHSREILGFGFVPLTSNLSLNNNLGPAQIISPALPYYQVVFFNLNSKILSDQNVRTALSLATDKQQIISQIFNGRAITPSSPLLFFNAANQPEVSPTDVNQGNSLLESIGWKIDPTTGLRSSKKGTILEITIATNDMPVNAKTSEILASQWRRLGIKVNINVLPGKQLTDTLIKPRTFDVLLFPQKFRPDPDPFLFWHSSQIKDPGFNLTGFADNDADKLITQARTTTDKKVRQQLYQQFNAIVMAKAAVIFLDQTEYVYVVDNSVKNINLNVLYDPNQRFSNIKDWFMAEARVWKK